MPASASVTWNPGPLNSALLRGFKASVYEARDLAKATAPSHKAGAVARLDSPTVGTLVPTGLGWVFQEGRKAGYPIYPGASKGFRKSAKGTVTFGGTRTYSFRSKRGGGAQALHFRGGGFAAYATGGAMAAEPYLSRAGAAWATQLGPRTMGASCAAAGFSAVRSIR